MNRRSFLKGTLFGFIGAVLCPKDLFSIPINYEKNKFAFGGEIKLNKDSDDTEIPKDLIKFAKDFSNNFKRLSNNGLYISSCGKYQIKYFDYLRGNHSGKIIDTPYRVSNRTGIMEFSKVKMIDMPQSFIFNAVIWCYLIYKAPSDYVAADVKSINCSLKNGFSKKELFTKYCDIFKSNMYEFNINRKIKRKFKII